MEVEAEQVAEAHVGSANWDATTASCAVRSFAISTTAHPALILHEAATSSRQHPRIPAPPKSESPGSRYYLARPAQPEWDEEGEVIAEEDRPVDQASLGPGDEA